MKHFDMTRKEKFIWFAVIIGLPILLAILFFVQDHIRDIYR